ncbi:hypothetical protein [Aeromonas veronii]|uniref:hypothetical protein n=1 Tax=Aeromonas veronii TaxID=654 RepID=UPI003D2126A3
MSKLEFGKTYYPPKQGVEISDNLVSGNGWKAERVESVITLEFLAARHGGGVDRYNITEVEFEELKKRGGEYIDALIRKYDC